MPRTVFAVLLHGVLTLGALAQDPQAELDAIFGKDLATVRRTAATVDDLKLAREMIDRARGVNAPLQAAILLRAFDLARTEPKDPTAHEALDVLNSEQPSFRRKVVELLIQLMDKKYGAVVRQDRKDKDCAEWRDLRLELGGYLEAEGKQSAAYTEYKKAKDLEEAIQSGKLPEICARIVRLNLRTEALARRDTMLARLASNPMDRKLAREVVLMLAIDLGELSHAKRYAHLTGDASFAALSAWPDGSTDPAPAERMRLAEWYDAHGRVRSNRGVVASLAAKNHFEVYLEGSGQTDRDRVKAKRALEKIASWLQAVGNGTAPRPAQMGIRR